jgi:hypothetical protein
MLASYKKSLSAIFVVVFLLVLGIQAYALDCASQPQDQSASFGFKNLGDSRGSGC